MRTLTAKEKEIIISRFSWHLSFMIIDLVTKFGDNANELEQDISDAVTAYHNALRANWGESK